MTTAPDARRRRDNRRRFFLGRQQAAHRQLKAQGYTYALYDDPKSRGIARNLAIRTAAFSELERHRKSGLAS